MKFFPPILFLFVISSHLHLSSEATSFPLTLTKNPTSLFKNNLLSSEDDVYKMNTKYTMVLIATIPIGGESQPMNMVVDTGSEIGWLRCANRTTDLTKTPAMFVPFRSRTFSEFVCNQSSDDCVTDSGSASCVHAKNVSNPRWHFSYFYEDQFHVEGDLFKDTVVLSRPQRIILGCTSAIEPSGAHGLMGMNLGKISFPTQADVTTFSYCVPLHDDRGSGKFYLGSEPDEPITFEYIKLLEFDIPSVDKNAYLVLLKGIHVAGETVSVEDAMLPPGISGGSAVMIDSAAQYSFLLANTYGKLREIVANVTKGFGLASSNDTDQFDMCFLGGNEPKHIYTMIGDLTFEFENNVMVTVPEERILDYIDDKLCVTIGKPSMVSDTATTHILGLSHQQCHWVKYDIQGRRVGFGKTELCEPGNYVCG